jgi:hypothetical protein
MTRSVVIALAIAANQHALRQDGGIAAAAAAQGMAPAAVRRPPGRRLAAERDTSPIERMGGKSRARRRSTVS